MLKATDYLLDAVEEVSTGDYDKAVTDYRKAWEAAIISMKKL